MNALPYYGETLVYVVKIKKQAGAELCQTLVKVWYLKTLVDQCNHVELLQKCLLSTWARN